MTKTWIISDTHFGHDACYTRFRDENDNPIRPWAASADEGDKIMREKWNDLIAPDDKVYHLGDVAIPRRGLQAMFGLHGRKVLIRGNHDIFKMKDYAQHFEDIRGTHKLGKFILTHYPIHEESIPAWCAGIIHGHTHGNLVRTGPWNKPDNRFYNACVEHFEGGPVLFDDIIKEFENRA